MSTRIMDDGFDSSEMYKLLERLKVEYIKNMLTVSAAHCLYLPGGIKGLVDEVTLSTLSETYVCLVIGEDGSCATGYGRRAGDKPEDHADARAMAERHAVIDFCHLSGIPLPVPKSAFATAEHPGIKGFDWKKHPLAKYIAQDHSGRWYWYESHPVPLESDKIWFAQGGKTGRVTRLLPRFFDWQKSLIERPTGA